MADRFYEKDSGSSSQLEYRCADEILRLNQDLINPAVLQVGMEVTVYAR
jgi:hypothetical protein